MSIADIMIVGVCHISLRMPGNMSLKDKRRVLKAIKAQTKNRFDIVIAEVADHDLWQMATLGICCISNNGRYANEVLSKAVNFIANGRFEVEMLDYNIEIIPC